MNPHIVATDDDPAIRKILQIMLRKAGYEVSTCKDGNELLELLKFQSQTIDLLLLDIKMPGFNGLELLDMIHQSYARIPIVMVTAFNDLDTGMKAMRSGASDYLTKPVHYEDLIACIKRVLDQVAKKAHKLALEEENIKFRNQLEEELQQALLALKDTTSSTLQAFTETIEQKDPYTKGHCNRVRDLSIALAKATGQSLEMLEIIEGGSLLHDIGKISIPEDILNKDTRLTSDEYEIIKTHPAAGEKIISHLPQFKRFLPIVRSHHERIDGKGYPDGLKSDEIPLEVRIVSLADAFDAMTSSRAYRTPLPTEMAVEELKFFSGSQFDSDLVEVFIENELYLL
jgi:putative two-component system response regulator